MIQKYQDGTATQAEQEFVDRYYAVFDQLNQGDELDDAGRQQMQDQMEVWLLNHINVVGGESVEEGQRQGVRRYRIGTWAAVAAAVATIIFGVWFFNSERGILKQVQDEVAVNDIAPGQNGATITLANGAVIKLSGAKSGVVVGSELKYSDGSDVRYSSGTSSSGSLKGSQNSSGPVGVRSLTPSELQGAEVKAQNLTAATSRGQTYQFVLPDGTRVWLNADSKIEFPSNFVNSKTRNVILVGEAYFEVAKDKLHPFIVESAGTSGRKGQRIEVLGTHFNVSTYADERVATTTLLEGSIAINNKVLKPNQQAEVMGQGGMIISEVDASEAIAWKEGFFSYKGTPLEQVMRQVARWYNVTVVYENEAVKTRTLSGAVSRYDNVSRILKTIENTDAVQFRIAGRTVYVK